MHRRSWIAVALFGITAAFGCGVEDEVPDLATADGVLLNPEPDLFLPTATEPAVSITDAAGNPLAPVHAHLMPDGRVLLIGTAGNAGLLTPPPLTAALAPSVRLAATPPPATELPYPGWSSPPYQVYDNLFCGGHTQTADGAFLSVGATRYLFNTQTSEFAIFGTGYLTRFDGTTWTRPAGRMVVPGPQGDAIRWYPQATRLADGRVLVTGGYDMPAYGVNGQITGTGTLQISAELYDPATDAFTAVSDATNTPAAIWNPDYTHVHVLPYPGDYDAVVFGEAGTPVIYGSFPGTWFVQPKARPGNVLRPDGTSPQNPNNGASSVELPIRLGNGQWGYYNGAVLMAGGGHFTENEHSIDVYDAVANAWLPRRDMEIRRHHPSTVVLPDGRVLVVAGHDDPDPTEPRIRRAVYVDPAAGFTLREGMAEMGETRGYHTVTLLLPDGRVLVGGGRDAGPDSSANEKPTLRYLYPAYMFRSRPTIGFAPAALGYGTASFVTTTGAVTEAVLVGLGSMTHSFDSAQRYVQLALTPLGNGAFAVTGPPNPETAPPGYYMLFVLDAQRTPSLARIVRVR